MSVFFKTKYNLAFAEYKLRRLERRCGLGRSLDGRRMPREHIGEENRKIRLRWNKFYKAHPIKCWLFYRNIIDKRKSWYEFLKKNRLDNHV